MCGSRFVIVFSIFKVTARMRHAMKYLHSGFLSKLLIGRITIRLQEAYKVFQQSARTFFFSPGLILKQDQVIYYIPIGPQISLMSTAPLLTVEHVDACFISLDILTLQYLPVQQIITRA